MDAPHPLPLANTRILAIEQMQAMPYATQLLAHLGAEVVKVEHPVHGESGRSAAPQILDDDGNRVGATYLRNNLGKSSIGLDLKNPEAIALIKRLVPHYDAVVENFKPGTMERLGLGYEVLSELHPPLVYASVSGFGSLLPTPYRDWPAYVAVAEAMGGLNAFRPEPGRKPIIGVAGALGDIGSGLFAAVGILAALNGARATGIGQRVDVAMMDAVIALIDMLPFHPSIGVTDNQLSAWPGICTSFAAKDGLFIMQVGREHQFERMAHALGKPEWLEDERFASREGWRDHLDEVIRPVLEAWASDKTKIEVCQLLADQGIVAGPIFDGDDIVNDPHVKSHDMVLSIERPDAETPLHVVGNPVKLSRSPAREVERWPRLGADTDAILKHDLGLSQEELARLREAGAIR